MKQHINKEQWNTLSKEQKENFLNLDQKCNSKKLTLSELETTENFLKMFLAFVNIGNMIEMLHEITNDLNISVGKDNSSIRFLALNKSNFEFIFNEYELCNALYEALKEVL